MFVPERPPRRLARAAGHGAFLDVRCSKSMALRPGSTVAVARRRQSAAAEHSRNSMVQAGGALGIAAAATAMASMAGPVGPAAAMLKLGMLAPPPFLPPSVPVDGADRQAQGAASEQPPRPMQPGPGSLLEMIFPAFETDTFIWRISCLQLTNYLASLMLGSYMGTPKLCSLYLLGASWGPSIASGALWRLMLPMLLHANALHIFFNMFFQLRIGFGMEKQFGKRKFCLLYLFCGFLGNLLSVVANPFKLAVGASTSGFGLLGVWAAEVLLTWELLGTSRMRLLTWFLFMIASCVMMSTLSPSVDFVGHFGGALAGFLLAIILADMREEHRPSWYDKAKTSAKTTTAFLILCCLLKAVTFGPDGPVPYCGSIFSPRVLPF